MVFSALPISESVARVIWAMGWSAVLSLLLYDNVARRGVSRQWVLAWMFSGWIGVDVLFHFLPDWRLAAATLACGTVFIGCCIVFVFWRPALDMDPELGNAPAWARDPIDYPLSALVRLAGVYKAGLIVVLLASGILG